MRRPPVVPSRRLRRRARPPRRAPPPPVPTPAGGAGGGDRVPGEAPARRPVAAPEAPLQQDEQGRPRQVPQRLVEEGRVEQGPGGAAGRQVGVVDLQAPGQRGGGAEELLVEPVAHAPHRLGHEEGRGDGVGQGGQAQPAPAHEPRGRRQPRGDAAPDAQSAPPDLHDADGVAPRPEVGVRGGDDVVQPGAENAHGHAQHGHVQNRIPVAAARAVAPGGPPHGDEDAREDAQRVGAQREGAQMPRVARGAGDRGGRGGQRGDGEHSEDLSTGGGEQ